MAVGGGEVDGPTTSSNAAGGVRTVSASGTANTKGAYVELVTSTAADADGMLVMYAQVTSNVSHLCDFSIGGAGSEVLMATNLHLSAGNNVPEWFYVPGPIPAGSRIACRTQCSTASSQLVASCVLVKGGWFAPPPGGSIVTLGANTADSGGTPINAGAVANTFGAWVQLTASTPQDIKAMALKVGGINNTTPTVGSGVFQIGFGAAAAEVPVLAVPNRMGTALDNYGPMPDFWFPCSIPAGSRVAARWMSTVTDATDRVCDLIGYGLECA